MNKNKITGFFVDPELGIAAKRTIPHDLDAFYNLLRCRIVEMPTRSVGGREFTIICDEEGTYRDDPRISAIDPFYQPMLVGPLFVVSCDCSIGELISLDNDDLNYIAKHIRHLGTQKHPDPSPMLCDVTYY